MNSVSIPTKLLFDKRITDQMLLAYIRLKAGVKIDLLVRNQLVEVGLIRKTTSSPPGNSECIKGKSVNAPYFSCIEDANALGDICIEPDSSSSRARIANVPVQGSNYEPQTGPGNMFPSEATKQPPVVVLLSNKMKARDIKGAGTHTRIDEEGVNEEISSEGVKNNPRECAREEPQTREPNPRSAEYQMTHYNQLKRVKDKIRIFSIVDERPFNVRWTEFVKSCRAMHQYSCTSIISSYLADQLKIRAQTAGSELALNVKDWNTVQKRFAKELFIQYPHWQEADWQEAVDWFLNDSFWGGIIIDIKTLRKNINRYVVWKQRKEPQKTKFASVKIIGRKS